MKECSIPDCSRPHLARGYCKPHWRRWRAYGDPLAGDPLPEQKAAVPEGFKDCTRCRERKSLEEFSPAARGARGRASRCKQCVREAAAERRENPSRRGPGRPPIPRNTPPDVRPRQMYKRPPAEEFARVVRRMGYYSYAAKEIGVPWHAVKGWLDDPEYRAIVEREHFRNDPEFEAVKAELQRIRARVYQQRKRAEDPEEARRVRREHMRKYGPEYRRKWNNYNRLRRKAAAPPPSPETEAYLRLIAGDPCVYCGGPFEHADHIRSLAAGGTNDWWNFAPTCATCNLSKSTESVLHFLMRRSA